MILLIFFHSCTLIYTRVKVRHSIYKLCWTSHNKDKKGQKNIFCKHSEWLVNRIFSVRHYSCTTKHQRKTEKIKFNMCSAKRKKALRFTQKGQRQSDA